MELRQTGRTQRMLEDAVHQARSEHKYVVVVAATETQRKQLYNRILQFFELAHPTNEETCKVLFDGGGSISLLTAGGADLAGRMDWQTGNVRGQWPDIEVLADHFAIERQMGWALEQWMKWNEIGGEHGTSRR